MRESDGASRLFLFRSLLGCYAVSTADRGGIDLAAAGTLSISTAGLEVFANGEVPKTLLPKGLTFPWDCGHPQGVFNSPRY